MFKRKQGTVFRLQSDQTIGSVTSRRQLDDLSSAWVDMHSDGANTRRMGTPVPRRRLRIAVAGFALLILLFALRAADLQLRKGSAYRALAEGNRFRSEHIVPQRGLIYDRNGIVLARNIPSFVLTMTIADLPKRDVERRAVFARVSTLAGIQPTDLDLLLTDYARTPNDALPVKRHLPYEQALLLAIETKQLSGFTVSADTLRSYPSTALSLSHVLGYTGKLNEKEARTLRERGYRPTDAVGKLGVERAAEERLRGTPGEIVTEVDARGRTLTVSSQTEPEPGSSVRLTIDAAFQAFIEERLQNLFRAGGASRASVVALDPQTGEVYALVSLPGYDANGFARGIDQESFAALMNDPDQPLFARAISGEFPSGSTFKPFMAYAALADGLVNEHTSFVSSGGLNVGGWFFPDWKPGGHGVTDVTKAIAQSVNTYFYIVGGGFNQFNGLGVKRITDYAALFGFGSPTGLDLPGEADGFLPSKAWKEEVKGERWYVGDTYHLAIGQGDFLTTPLQMAVATGTIANDGVRMKPRVLEETVQAGEPISGLDSTAMRIVKRAMRETVLSGSARSLSGLPFSSAGKTGTAQAPGHDRFHSWFAGFAPYENPRIALAVLVENGGESTDAAVPLAREMLYWWLMTNRGALR